MHKGDLLALLFFDLIKCILIINLTEYFTNNQFSLLLIV